MPVAIGIAKSTALYVFLSLPACIWIFGVEFADAKSAAAHPTSFADWFLCAGFWALPALIATVILSTGGVLAQWVFSRRYRRIFKGESLAIHLMDNVIGGLGYAFINPYHGLRNLFGIDTDETGFYRVKSLAFQVFHLCWAISLVTYLAFGFLALS